MKFLTVATDAVEKSELRLMSESAGQAIVVLADYPYYESLESTMKIHKYAKQRNVMQLPKSMQDIIGNQKTEAGKYETSANEQLKKAIENAAFYVDGEHIEIKSGDAKSRIDQALEYLVSHVYSELDLITKNADSDADVMAVLNGSEFDGVMAGLEPNRDAAVKMEEYLEMQSVKNLPTSMADIQSRYQAIPYGWKEIDIAYVAAMLVYEQKVTIKYAGVTIQPSDPKLVDMLRKKSEIGKTSISKRQIVSVSKMKEAKEFLRDYFDVMDVPDDEDGLIAFIVKKFSEQKTHYEALDALYAGHKYPDHSLVSQALTLMDDVLSQQKDNIALVDRVIKKQDAIYDNKEAMQNVEGFFKNQVAVYDAAVQLEADLHNELDYLSKEPEANTALNQIRLITNATGKFEYKKIPDLNGLMTTVHEGHDRLLAAKRDELLEIVRQCMEAIHTTAHLDTDRNIVAVADTFYTQRKERIAELKSLALLDGLLPQMLTYKDDTVEKLETMHKPAPQPSVVNEPGTAYGGGQPQPKKVIKALNRSVVFPAKKLESDADIDAYVEKMRDQLKQLMKNCDGIQLK